MIEHNFPTAVLQLLNWSVNIEEIYKIIVHIEVADL